MYLTWSMFAGWVELWVRVCILWIVSSRWGPEGMAMLEQWEGVTWPQMNVLAHAWREAMRRYPWNPCVPFALWVEQGARGEDVSLSEFAELCWEGLQVEA